MRTLVLPLNRGEYRRFVLALGLAVAVAAPGRGDPPQVRLDHGGAVHALALVPEALLLASADGRNGKVLLWDLASGTVRHELDFFAWGVVPVIDLSHDGSRLLVGAGEHARVFRTDKGSNFKTTAFEQPVAITAVTFSSKDRRAAFANSHGGITVLDAGELGLGVTSDAYLHDQSVLALALAPDGKTLASAWLDGTVGLWEVRELGDKPALLRRWNKVAAVALAFSADGKHLTAADKDGTVRVLEAATGKELRQLKLPVRPGMIVALSPDGRTLAAGGGEDPGVCLWDLTTGQERRHRVGLRAPVSALVFARDGKTLAGGCTDGAIVLWRCGGGGHEKLAARTDLSDRELQRLWDDVMGMDVQKCQRAYGLLLATPTQTVPFLRQLVTESSALPADRRQRIEQLIRDLDSDSFIVRQRAEEALAKLGRQAEPVLKQSLAGQPSLEVRRRIEGLLQRFVETHVVSRERQQALWVIDLLEALGNSDARALLTELAQGKAELVLQQEAQAALKRFSRQTVDSPERPRDRP